MLVGVGGLRWTDVTVARTPHLWNMLDESSVGSIPMGDRGAVVCPLDAWLTLSAGRRIDPVTTTDEAPTGGIDVDGVGDSVADCPAVPVPATTKPAGVGPATIPEWSTLVPVTDAEPATHPSPGTLGALLTEANARATAVGPGAALMLANSTGQVANYAPSLAALPDTQLTAPGLTVIDQGVLPEDSASRRTALTALDDSLKHVMNVMPRGGRLLIAGVANTPQAPQGFQVVVDWRAPGNTATWLRSDSTRWQGIAQLTDLTATVTTAAGAASDHLVGTTLEAGDERRMGIARTVENRAYLNVLSSTISTFMPVLVGALIAILLAALAATIVARRHSTRRGLPLPPGPAGTRALAAIALLVGCAPAAASLATLTRWWVAPAPTFVLTFGLAAATCGLALLAWFSSRLLPPAPWRLAAASSALTWLILTVDGLTRTTLQQGSLIGPSPAMGARFYGFNNMTFAVYAVAATVLAGALATWFLTAGRRRGAILTVAAVGVITVVVDGWPAFGADFGGILALVPAFTVLALLVGGVRITTRRVLWVVLTTVVVVAAISIIDWLMPATSTHLGDFVQNVVDGDALPVVSRKARGAWATIANAGGALALVGFVAAAFAALHPERFKLTEVRTAYRRWPTLRPIVCALILAASVGSALNDSGIVIAVVFLLVSVSLLVATFLADLPVTESAAAGSRNPVLEAETAGPATLTEARMPATRAPRHMPAALLATGGGLLITLLLATLLVPAPAPLVAAGAVPTTVGQPIVDKGDQLVIIGTSGLRWQDVSESATPTLWGMLRDGAGAAGVTAAITGANGSCDGAGWLALSAGRSPITGERVHGRWTCLPWSVRTSATTAGGAVVQGWSDLGAVQHRSEYKPTLGVLAGAIRSTDACATAVGPRAALALADAEGQVARYRRLSEVTTRPTDVFSCPITMVDVGSAPYSTRPANQPGTTADGPARQEALRAVDTGVRDVLRAAPDNAKIILVDTGNPAPGRIWLGVGVTEPAGPATPRYLTTASTHWEGVIRLLDLPLTIVAAVGASVPADFAGAPYLASGARPVSIHATVDQLADLSSRDHSLRRITGTVTITPIYLGLALLALAILVLPRIRRSRIRATLRTGLDRTFLVLAAIAPATFLVSVWSWWRFEPVTLTMWAALMASTAIIAGVAAMVPRLPLWAGPGLLGAITFGVLSLDAALGTPLHRGGPLGPAPTLGGRFYGFGNPTYSVYVVGALFAAAACATWWLNRGHKRIAVTCAVAIGTIALIVDLWPSLGADVGGGLVLVPTFAILVAAVAGIKITLRRFAVISIAGVLAVGVIGFVDWMGPADQRSHLGIFVQSVIDGTAWETVMRKAAYAGRTVTSGFPAGLTLVVVIALICVLWKRVPLRAAWLDRIDRQWPLMRPTLVSLLVAAIAGGVLNDYGVRVAIIMLFAAIPIVGLLIVRSTEADDAAVSTPAGTDEGRVGEPSVDTEPAEGAAQTVEKTVSSRSGRVRLRRASAGR